ncbi:hypothetical protein [Bacillus cereus]|uniref:hypothetical protein n=1 Tax=Bacillus cereus TaxID=1396 RepID=UPI001F5E2EEA|nr:hypothetical protein [Bacillus cereus]
MKKTCTVCGENKLLEEFAKDKAKKDGCRNQCKSCINLRKRKTPIMPKPKQGHKHCAKCRGEKQLSEFNIRSVNGGKGYSVIVKSAKGNTIITGMTILALFVIKSISLARKIHPTVRNVTINIW